MIQQFTQCSNDHDNTKDTLRCCLRECERDFNCQEQCIESYNSLIHVEEHYVSPYYKKREIILLVALLLYHISIIKNVFILPDNNMKKIACVSVTYILIYLVIFTV